MLARFLFIYLIMQFFCSCHKSETYTILYPKKITTHDTPESLKNKFSLVNHPDNPKKDSYDYYVYQDSILGNIRTEIFVSFSNGKLSLVNIKYFGQQESIVNLKSFYDSCLSQKFTKSDIGRVYSRTNQNFIDTAIVYDKGLSNRVGYYYFEERD